VLIPKYDLIDADACGAKRLIDRLEIPLGGGSAVVAVWQGTVPNTDVPLYMIDWPGVFVHPIYSEGLSAEDIQRGMRRFTLFAWAAALVIPKLPWGPDILHLHDWHAAPVKAFQRALQQTRVLPTILTIHNLNIQGKWNAEEVWSWLGLRGDETPALSVRDRDGDFNALQIGIRSADAVTTVSPRYAQEITTPQFGERLEGDLLSRPDGVYGIINGIDTEMFSAERDPNIKIKYAAANLVQGKAGNKAALISRCGWSDDNRPVLVFIGRLTPQKGVDVLCDTWPKFVATGARLVVLGSGQPALEQKLVDLAKGYPDSVFLRLGFDAAFSSQLYAGGDFLIMPSRFEPCGLTQLVAMRYATIPIVSDTGGLHDTVIDVGRDGQRGTGVVFADASSGELSSAIDRALKIYHHRAEFQRLQKHIIGLDFSWYNSVRKYVNLYEKIRR
jgi:starch synthase